MSGLYQRFIMLLELVRFSHTIFALPFAILATVMAFRVPLVSGQRPELRWLDLLGVLLCMVFARTAAMAFNRWVDHRFDAANPRTAGRHLPAGLMRRGEVLGLTLGSAAAFIASTAIFLPNRLPLVFSTPEAALRDRRGKSRHLVKDAYPIPLCLGSHEIEPLVRSYSSISYFQSD